MGKRSRKTLGMGFLFVALFATAVVFFWAHHETQIRLGFSEDVNEALDSFIESEHFGFAILDEEGSVVEWNPAMETLTGFSKTAVQQGGLGQLMPSAEDNERHEKALHKAFEQARQASWDNISPKATVIQCEIPGKKIGDPNIPIRVSVRILKAKSGRYYAIANTEPVEAVHVIKGTVSAIQRAKRMTR